MRGRYKAWAAPYLSAHPEVVLGSLNKNDPFFANAPLYLEIGAGKGDFVLQMAAKGGYYLALERDVSIAGTLAKRVVESGLGNIRVMAADFDALLESFAGFSFAGIFLNFSDPWPKKKHWKRRLTTRGRLSEYEKLLVPGGTLAIKSDNESLYEFTKEEALSTSLTLVDDQPAYVFDEASDAMSEYERNFRSQGLPIHRLVYRKAKQE